MALIDFTGFENQLDNKINTAFFDFSGGSDTQWDMSTDTRYGVGRSVYCSYGNVGIVYFDDFQTIITGHAFKFGGTSYDYNIWVTNSDTQYQATFVIDPIDGQIRCYRGSWVHTLLGSSGSNVFKWNAWNYFEFKITLSNTVGEMTARINGVNVVSVTNVDTLYTGTNETFDRLTYSFPSYGYVDDIYICDDTGATNNDFLGDVIVDLIKPSANGNQNDGTASAGSNYECVNEQEQDDADYVTLDAVNEIELYTMEDLPSTSYTKTIYGVKPILRMSKTASGARTVTPILRVNSSNYEHSSDITLSPDAITYNPKYIWEVNPDDSNVWEEADINALEAGIKVTA